MVAVNTGIKLVGNVRVVRPVVGRGVCVSIRVSVRVGGGVGGVVVAGDGFLNLVNDSRHSV
jgi:hypothetical protein